MINLIPQNALYKPTNLKDFISQLRRFKKSSIINSGRYLLWEYFRSADFRQKHEKKGQIFQAYGPRIIIIALATANDWRNQSLTPDDFHSFCTSYLHIPNSISDEKFTDDEAQSIYKHLRAATKNPDTIPIEYLDIRAIRFSCSTAFVARGMGIQHQSFNMGVEEFYRDAHILKCLDARSDKEISAIMESKLGFTLLQVLRACWCLYTFGMYANNNGMIVIPNCSFNADLSQKYDVDEKTCAVVASAFSYKETELRASWLEGKVFKEHEYYQPYYPDPLFNKPIIHLDSKRPNENFLIPSPMLFIRGLRHALFSLVVSEAKNKGKMLAAIGDCIEDHIYTALCAIFSKEKTIRLDGAGKHADFFIELDAINIIIEVKTNIAGIVNKSVMKPEHIADMWNRLYYACLQCSASIAAVPKNNKKMTIPVVIVGDHMTAEYIPFHAFAEFSKLYESLKIGPIEYLSWNSLESSLSGTSISKFEESLLKKWSHNKPKNLEEFVSLELDRDRPAHNYEYLNETKQEIFIKDFAN